MDPEMDPAVQILSDPDQIKARQGKVAKRVELPSAWYSYLEPS